MNKREKTIQDLCDDLSLDFEEDVRDRLPDVLTHDEARVSDEGYLEVKDPDTGWIKLQKVA